MHEYLKSPLSQPQLRSRKEKKDLAQTAQRRIRANLNR